MGENRVMPDQPGRRRTPAPRPSTRSELAKTGRLWLLSLICAGVGAYVVSRTDSVLPGVVAFLITLAVLGPVLWVYERRRSQR